MKTVTYEEFLKFKPCWLKYKDGAERIKAYFDRFGGSMSALDILNLDDVSAEEKLWSVLREEFMPAPIIHEFTCVCAEYALSPIENPDPRSINAIKVKRAWIRGEATDEELDTARDAAWCAYDAASAAAWDATRAAAWDVSWDAYTSAARHAAARHTAGDSARYAAVDAASADWYAYAAAREAQVAYLIMALEEEK